MMAWFLFQKVYIFFKFLLVDIFLENDQKKKKVIKDSVVYMLVLVGYNQNTIMIEYLITKGETKKLAQFLFENRCSKVILEISIKYYNMPGFSNHNCIAGIPLIALMGAGDKGGAPTAPAKSL